MSEHTGKKRSGRNPNGRKPATRFKRKNQHQTRQRLKSDDEATLKLARSKETY